MHLEGFTGVYFYSSSSSLYLVIFGVSDYKVEWCADGMYDIFPSIFFYFQGDITKAIDQ